LSGPTSLSPADPKTQPADTQARRLVVLSLLGNTLDGGFDVARWERWRPTVAMTMFDDLRIDRIELLAAPHVSGLRDLITADIAAISPETMVRAHAFSCDDPWDFEQVYEGLHGFARAYPFDPDREDYLVHITTGTHVMQICLFLLTEARFIPGRLLQTSPPPLPSGRHHTPGQYRVIDLDLSRYDRIATRSHQEQGERLSFLKYGIATRSPAFNRLIERIERVAIASPSPLLLIGPTGAGKTRLARRIYDLKKSKHLISGPYVEVNCATLRGEQAMAALFGHVKGAFTGAVGARPGLLRAADGGVLFLDEIGELGLDEQAMLLKAIESGTFLPVGSDQEVSSRFQLIAGTNRDLFSRVSQQLFREDLLARINLWTFDLPGLRERPEDIEPNLDFELDQLSARFSQSFRFNLEARQRFLQFAASPQALWRGSFRELNGALERMCTLSPAGRITLDAVEEEITRLQRAWHPRPTPQRAPWPPPSPSFPSPSDPTAPPADPSTPPPDPLASLLSPDQIDQIDLFDQLQLRAVLQVCSRCRTLSDAGRALFGVSRTQKKSSPNDADRLRKFLARFHLDWRTIPHA
jgi:transcriptional regulatory protein RtcR